MRVKVVGCGVLGVFAAAAAVVGGAAWWITGPHLGTPVAIDPVPDVSAERIRSDVERLCNDFGPRDCRQLDNLNRAAAWIAGEMRQAGLRVEYQEYEISRGRYRNVIGRRPGSDHDAGAIIIGAHYDTVRGSAGADDNASGVAALLELVRTLPKEPGRHSLWFVAFSTEEQPCSGERMGSEELAQRLASEGIAVELMLSLDMIGYFTDERGSQSPPIFDLGLLYPSRGNFLAVFGDFDTRETIGRVKLGLGAAGDLRLRSFAGPDGLLASDHLPFRELGLPAVLLTDTGPLRFPHWHGSGDVPELLDYGRMAEIVRALHGLLAVEDAR